MWESFAVYYEFENQKESWYYIQKVMFFCSCLNLPSSHRWSGVLLLLIEFLFRHSHFGPFVFSGISYMRTFTFNMLSFRLFIAFSNSKNQDFTRLQLWHLYLLTIVSTFRNTHTHEERYRGINILLANIFRDAFYSSSHTPLIQWDWLSSLLQP